MNLKTPDEIDALDTATLKDYSERATAEIHRLTAAFHALSKITHQALDNNSELIRILNESAALAEKSQKEKKKSTLGQQLRYLANERWG